MVIYDILVTQRSHIFRNTKFEFNHEINVTYLYCILLDEVRILIFDDPNGAHVPKSSASGSNTNLGIAFLPVLL